MSGILGQLLQGFTGGGQGQSSTVLNAILQQVLAVQDGDKQGIPAIIQKFQNAGLGSYVQSWVGTGSNTPITQDQVGSAFSPQQIQGWAQQAGITPEAIQDVLARALPHVVDHLTPGGQVPAQTPSQTGDLAGLVGKLLGGGRTA